VNEEGSKRRIVMSVIFAHRAKYEGWRHMTGIVRSKARPHTATYITELASRQVLSGNKQDHTETSGLPS